MMAPVGCVGSPTGVMGSGPSPEVLCITLPWESTAEEAGGGLAPTDSRLKEPLVSATCPDHPPAPQGCWTIEELPSQPGKARPHGDLLPESRGAHQAGHRWAGWTGTTQRWHPCWVRRACDHLVSGSLWNPDSQSQPLCPGELACQGMSLLTLSCRHAQRKLFIPVRSKSRYLLTGSSRRRITNLSILPGTVAEGLQGGSENSTPIFHLCLK